MPGKNYRMGRKLSRVRARYWQRLAKRMDPVRQPLAVVMPTSTGFVVLPYVPDMPDVMQTAFNEIDDVDWNSSPLVIYNKDDLPKDFSLKTSHRKPTSGRRAYFERLKRRSGQTHCPKEPKNVRKRSDPESAGLDGAVDLQAPSSISGGIQLMQARALSDESEEEEKSGTNSEVEVQDLVNESEDKVQGLVEDSEDEVQDLVEDSEDAAAVSLDEVQDLVKDSEDEVPDLVEDSEDGVQDLIEGYENDVQDLVEDISGLDINLSCSKYIETLD